jgi:hypothetical protein
MTRQEYQELLSFKEERVDYWEEYGYVLSKDGITCEWTYPEARI